ncbi:MAG: glycosyltransferase family 2 protein [Planctomycetes bacterium]|nr:glycosyltransferase family 2 protein [Planctomycetota bacterium]
MIATVILVTALGLVAYTYLGYPVLLFLAASVAQAGRDMRFLFSRRNRRRQSGHLPKVSLIVAAYNEEAVIAEKVVNCLELDYPADRLEVIIGSDGSTDGTDAAVKSCDDSRVRFFGFAERRGKLPVLQELVEHATGEVLLFSDADILLRPDAVRKLIRHFVDSNIGAVCGELAIVTAPEAQSAESVYWRYEVMLRFLESRLDSALGASGAIYAVRRSLFPRIPRHVINDDFVIPMKVRSQGYRVTYDPEAVATYANSANVFNEFRRRARIGAGNLQALYHCRDLLLPWKGPVAFSFWSHKVIRWLVPFLLLAAFVANLFLLGAWWGRALFGVQVVGYALAGVSLLCPSLVAGVGLLRLPGYFVVLNAGLFWGFVTFARGRHGPTWQPRGQEG